MKKLLFIILLSAMPAACNSSQPKMAGEPNPPGNGAAANALAASNAVKKAAAGDTNAVKPKQRKI